MKMVIILLTTAILQVSAAGFAQKITMNKKNAPLDLVIKEIRKQSGYDFIYKLDLLEKANTVTINVKNADIVDVLNSCFKGQPFTYSIEDKAVIVKEVSLVERMKEKINDFFQQDSTLYRGKIYDEKGLPLPGATIYLKGGIKVSRSGADGYFERYGTPKSTMVVKYVGYQTQEISLKEQKPAEQIIVKMIPGANDLGEVEIVSTGLFELPKERATGSFEVITAKQLQHSTDPNLLKRLEGISSVNFDNTKIATNSSATDGTTGRNGLYGQQFGISPLRNLTIRGRNTLSPGTDINDQSGLPLVVIDGVAMPYSVDMVDPEIVETVTLLKDAAANSVWGSRAANGVIVITTKKGKTSSPTSISFNTNMNITEKMDLFYKKKMSVSDYIDAQVFAYNQQYSSPTASIGDPSLTQPGNIISPVFEIVNQYKRGSISLLERNQQLDALRGNDIRNDYIKYFLRNAVNQNYNLSVLGGSAKISYALSGRYAKILNNTRNSDANSMNLNLNTTAKITKKFELAGVFAYNASNSNDQAANNRIKGANDATFYPYTRLADEQGNALETFKTYRPGFLSLLETNYGTNILNMNYKPLEDINEGYDKVKQQNFNINLGANYQLFPWLSTRLNYNYNRGNNEQIDFYSQNSFYMRELINVYTTRNYTDPVSGQFDAYKRNIPLGGLYSPIIQKSTNQNYQGKLIVNQTWNKLHSLNAVAGVDLDDRYAISRGDTYYGYNENTKTYSYLVDYSSYKNLLYTSPSIGSSFGTVSPLNVGISDTRIRTLGIYSNVAYTFDNRYTISASARKDASSEFGVGTNRKGTPFYSVGAGWNINNEHFYNVNWLPMLKLRGNFGYNGNVKGSITAKTYFNFSLAQTVQPSGLWSYISPTNVNNRNLRPEKTGILDIGLDFGIVGNRINGSLDYFNANTTDLIENNLLDATTGYSRTLLNTANLHRYGFEFNLSTINLKAGLFQWNSNFFFSYNRTKVTKLYVGAAKTTFDVVAGSPSYNQGYDLSRLFSYRWAGLDPLTGNPRGYLNGQPVSISNDIAGQNAFIAIQGQPMSEARYHGSIVPVYFGAFRNSFSYGSFSLSANFMYKLGYYFRRLKDDIANYGALFSPVAGGGAVLLSDEYYQRWQKPGDELSTNVPSLVYSTNSLDARNQFYFYSETNVLKADHIRLQEINLSYGPKIKGKWFIKNPRIYANVNNLGIIWRANKLGLDPDIYDYPMPRQYSLGFSASF